MDQLYVLLVPSGSDSSPNRVARAVLGGIERKLGKSCVLEIEIDCGGRLIGFFRALRRCRDIVGTNAKSICIHSHGIRPDILSWCLGLSRRSWTAKVRRISTVHSDIELDLIEKYGRLLGGTAAFIWKRVINSLDLAICVSENVAKRLRFERMAVIRNPIIPRESEHRKEDQLASSIIGIGVLRRIKRFDLLIAAASSRPAIEVCIIGEGPERSNLEALTKSMGLEDRVRFLGWVEDPAPHLRDAGAIAFTSESEGFPLAYLEALSTEVPIVCVDSPLWRSIGKEEHGVRFSKEEPAALGATLESCLAYSLSDEERAARTRELASHEIDIVANEYFRLAFSDSERGAGCI